jgi:hypothetical protein
MMVTVVGPWVIEHDPDTTRQCYARIPWGDDCDCDPCRNLDALGENAFPADARRVLGELGVDFHKPAEVHHIARLENGLQQYGGWYHCVGRIVSGRDASQPEAGTSPPQHFEAASFSGHFSISCSSARDLASEAFGDLPLVQVDFSAELPWVLDEPEPT